MGSVPGIFELEMGMFRLRKATILGSEASHFEILRLESSAPA